ncbi:Uncharacterised protein [Zhongshania aliphaticivorans]|uniref:DUF1499 domain-containing protein n=1 Tax=Zhongshania aliphaticivorans TaxID=1470434 RepID=A0A5S9MWD7_9GAMM|nr:Uncharacterised protein [Zhongshania aliphaticivorans]CAA0085316.1 Uncharacterised protein [Zhongshania aliphaticivorans]
MRKNMRFLLIVFGVLAFAFIVRVTIQNSQVPELGVKDGKLTEISSKPNNVSTQTDDPDKKVATLPFKSSKKSTMTALKQAVASYGNGKIEAEDADYLYVVFTTSLMHYHDDVEFWLDEKAQRVHYRSSSRAGYSDMGLNRQRYNDIAALYEAIE